MFDILLNTPFWAYLVLLFLGYHGIKACSPTQESKNSLIFSPLVLLAWAALALDFSADPTLLIGVGIAALLLGSLLGMIVFSTRGVELDDPENGLIVPGTVKTLVFYLLLFVANYYFGYQNDVHPENATSLEMLTLKAGAAGLAVGIFSGRSLKFYRLFRSLKARRAATAL
ncbi:hypothetical protein [Pseudomonas purpurea]|uniref:hypothetical protein n=1 Tax=Pseudomonas purpurea TaxID=3136737 RepID=UPI003266730F